MSSFSSFSTNFHHFCIFACIAVGIENIHDKLYLPEQYGIYSYISENVSLVIIDPKSTKLLYEKLIIVL